MTNIYCLKESGIEIVEYVGKTETTLRERLMGHYTDARIGSKTKKAKWIREVWNNGGEIEISLICECEPSQCKEVEESWIRHYLTVNPSLKNGTIRGESRKPTEQDKDIPEEGFFIVRKMKDFRENLSHFLELTKSRNVIVQNQGRIDGVLISYDKFVELKKKAGETID